MKPPILRDFPESFETQRLTILTPQPGDGPEMHAAVNESLDELMAWMPWPKNHKTVEDSEENVRRSWVRFMERTDLMLLLLSKETGTLVGSSGLHRIDWEVPKFEIGYWCRTQFAGKGYVTEAVQGITDFAFEELRARRVEIKCDTRNKASARVAEKAGYHLEGTLRNDQVSTSGDLRDTFIYSSGSPMILGLHHAQITIPKHVETEARDFYLGILEFEEIDKPESLAGRGGFWMKAGESTIHVGTEDVVDRKATKAHLAYEVDDLAVWRKRLADAGLEILDSVPIPGYDRFETRDPFGNRLEFIQRLDLG